MTLLSVVEKTTNSSPALQEASCEDGGLWRRLLQGAQEESTPAQSYFFVDVVEGCLPSSMFCKLGLPPLFMSTHITNLSELNTLEGPDGRRYPIMLGRQLDSQFCLSQGWKEFAADYHLQLQDKVVFLLIQHAHLLVQVFDANNNLKSRNPTPNPNANNIPGNTSPNTITNTIPDNTSPNTITNSSPNTITNISPNTINTSIPGNAFITDTRTPEPFPHRELFPDLEPFPDPEPFTSPQVINNASSTKENFIVLLDSDDDEQQQRPAIPPVPAFLTPEKSSRVLRSAAKQEESESVVPLKSPDEGTQGLKGVRKCGKVARRLENVALKRDNVGMGMGMHFESGALKGENGAPGGENGAPGGENADHMLVLKPSRRLQRKLGIREGEEFGRASVVRSGKRFKRSENQDVETAGGARLYEDLREVKQSEVLTSCCSTQQPAMKKQPLELRRLARQEVLGSARVEKKVAFPAKTEPKSPAPKPRPKSWGRTKKATSKATSEATSKSTSSSRHQTSYSSEEVVPKKQARQKPLVSFYISKRRPVTIRERQDAFAAAHAFAFICDRAHCVVQLKSSQVYCGFHLKFPAEFMEAMQLPSARTRVSLCDEAGKTWEAEWMGEAQRPALHSRGWTRFALFHFLEEGDLCVFLKPEDKLQPATISVRIFPVVPVVPTPDYTWQDHYTLDKAAIDAANVTLRQG